MSVRRKIPKGTVLFRPDAECEGFVQLLSGSIRVSLTAPNGRTVVLYRVTPGDVCLQTFACLVKGRRYSAEGVAETDLDAEVLSTREFLEGMSDDAEFRAGVFAAVVHRFNDYEQLVEDVALTGFDARLARALLRLRDKAGVVHATHQDLAEETASGRAFVSRRIGEFARDGVVIARRGAIEIADTARLEQIAAEER